MKSILLCARVVMAMFCLAATVYAQPKITSFSPAAGQAGTQLTITGSGFNTGPQGNFVFIGPVRTAAAATTPNSLTVIVPAGAASDRISVVNNATQLTGYSANRFVLAYPNPFGRNIQPTYFLPRVDFAASYLQTTAPIFSDFDGDGKIDLALSISASTLHDQGRVLVFQNRSSGGTLTPSSFSEAYNFIPDQFPSVVGAQDLNNDGKPELIVTQPTSGRIGIYINTTATGVIDISSFGGAASVPYSSGYSRFAAGDVDGDGRIDVILGYTNGTISVLRNTGSGTQLSFAPAVNFTIGTGRNLTDLQVNDLDGDGKPEVITTSYTDFQTPVIVTLLHNTAAAGSISTASFEAPVNLTLTGRNTLGGIKSADMDGDGKPDLLFNVSNGGTFDSGKVVILRNVSTMGSLTAASFAPETDIPAGTGVQALNVGDVDGDGKLDVLLGTSVFSNNTISAYATFLLNNATPGNLTASSFSPGPLISEPAITAVNLLDLDNDGKPELVVSGNSPVPFNSFATNFFSAAKIRQQPYLLSIASVSPASAPAGATVTITGTSFNETPSANIVTFGAVKATVTGSTSTSLTVTVPPGANYQPVTVLNTANGLSAVSPQPFVPTFTNPAGAGIAPGFYQTKLDFPSGTPAGAYPYSFAIGDVDGDGKPDMAIVHANSNTVTVLRNTSPTGSLNASSFTQQVSFPSGPNPVGVQIRDMDNDGKPDLVIVKALPDTASGVGILSVLRNTSVQGSLTNNSFASRIDFSIGSFGGAYSVAIGDLNSDGKPDIALGNLNNGRLYLFVNNSTPGNINNTSFTNPVSYDAPSPHAIAIADIDGDGVQDIIVTSETSKRVLVLRNQSTNGVLAFNTFGTQVFYPVDSLPRSLVLSDVDGDGKSDIITGNAGSNTISVLRNLSTPGNVSYSASFSFATGAQPFSISAGDADGDGKPDVIVANSGSNNLSILRNAGITGTINGTSFLPKVNFATGAYPVAVAIADLDGDGIAEAAALNAANSSVSVLKIGTQAPVTGVPPTVTSLNPASVYIGSSLTISGSNFNPDPAGNTVFFGAVKATITGGNANSLTVIVPAGATRQPVSVLNTANGLTGYSLKPFFPTFPSPFGLTIPGNFYLPKVDLAVGGSTPRTVTASDLDGDGKPDLLVVNSNPGYASTVSIYRNMSSGGAVTTGSFAPKLDVPVGNYALGLNASDVDGDGKPDLVVVNGFGFTVSVLRNTSMPGNISFAPAVDLVTNQYPTLSAVTDVDKDGKPDIVIRYNGPTYNCSIYRNVSTPGNINATSFVKIDINTNGNFQAITDMDGDGKPDLIVSVPGGTAISRNISSPGSISNSSFAPNVLFGFTASKITDIDGNGLADLVGTDSIRLNFSTPGNFGSAVYPASFQNNGLQLTLNAEDVDGDGKPDLLGTSSNQLQVQRNLGLPLFSTYLFAPPTSFAASDTPLAGTVVDLNGDGIGETVLSNYSGNSLSIFQINLAQKAPVVKSVSRDSSATGTTVRLTGVNFNSNPANDIVYFGAVRAQVTRATDFELDVTVPAGATYRYPTVLNNTTGLSGAAFRPFIHTFVTPFGSSVPANFYRPRTDFTTGALPYGLATGDLDGDGKSEIVTANYNDNTVSVLYNNTGGQINGSSFSTRINFAVGTNPYAVAIGDVDGDGKPDLVVANYGASTVSVLRNMTAGGGISPGSFAPKVDFSVGNFTYPIAVAIGDIDGDGKPEVLAANSLANNLAVLRNTSTPGSITAASFAPLVDFATGASPHSVAIGDIDGDYRPDVVTANQQAGTVSVLRNTAVSGSIDASSLAPKMDFAAGSDPYSVAIGVQHDNVKPDLLIANHGGSGNGTVTALQNTSLPGTVSFNGAQPLLSNSNMPFAAIFADVNGDGEPDVVQVNSATSRLSILAHKYSFGGQLQSGLFDSPVEFTTGGYPVAVAVGDLDGDGQAEAITANAAGTVSVFKIAATAQAVFNAGSLQSAASDKAAGSHTGLQVYPNPTNGSLTLQLRQPAGPVLVEVLDAAGKTLQKRQLNAAGITAPLTLGMSLRGQPAGVYYIKMTGVSGVQLEKVVLQK